MRHEQLLLDRQLCFSLYRASHAVIRAYRPLLDELQLTYPQYLVMLVLWEDETPRTVNGIAERLGLDTGTVTPLLRRLENAGLITRTWDTRDERRRLIALTDAGRDLRERAADVPERMMHVYAGDRAELERTKAVLDSLATTLS